MKNIFLHIGQGKTGSTAIQNTITVLQKRGILQQVNFVGLVDGIIPLISTEHMLKQQTPPVHKNLLVEYIQNFINNVKENNVIISCENFSNNFFLNQGDIPRLASLLKNYNVKVLIYLRRQDSRIESVWAQKIKIFKGSIEGPLLATKDHFYKQVIDAYADAFGKENITVRIYDRKKLYCNDSVSDFFEWCGLASFYEEAKKELDATIIAHKNVNPSLTPEVLRIWLSFMRQNRKLESAHEKINQLKSELESATPKHRLDIISQITLVRNGMDIDVRSFKTLRKLFTLHKPVQRNSHAYFSLEDRQNLLEAFREDNAAIAREYLGREDGILFDEDMPKEVISLKSPNCHDIVTTFLPIFVHFAHSIEQLDGLVKNEKRFSQLSLRIDKLNKLFCEIGNDSKLLNLSQNVEKLNKEIKKLKCGAKERDVLLNKMRQVKLSAVMSIKNLLLQPWIKKKAFALVNNGKLKEAEIIALNIIVNNPYMSWSYYILGKIQWAQGKRKLALEHIQKAIDLSPNTTFYRTYLKAKLRNKKF